MKDAESGPKRCDCLELKEALAEGAVSVRTFAKGKVKRVLYMLPHPSGDEGEARLMLFCPFCGQAAGDGPTFRAELWANN